MRLGNLTFYKGSPLSVLSTGDEILSPYSDTRTQKEDGRGNFTFISSFDFNR